MSRYRTIEYDLDEIEELVKKAKEKGDTYIYIEVDPELYGWVEEDSFLDISEATVPELIKELRDRGEYKRIQSERDEMLQEIPVIIEKSKSIARDTICDMFRLMHSASDEDILTAVKNAINK